MEESIFSAGRDVKEAQHFRLSRGPNGPGLSFEVHATVKAFLGRNDAIVTATRIPRPLTTPRSAPTTTATTAAATFAPCPTILGGGKMACSAHMPVVANSKLQPHFSSSARSGSLSRSPLSSRSQLHCLYDTSRAASLCLHAHPPHKSASRSRRILALAKSEPLRIMISGAPASGKGTQCELITQKYGLVHIAAGDLLRAEVAAGTENGRRAKEFMEKGKLVPDEIVVMMVKERLSQPDSLENGWLLDGYPRSSSQAIALKEYGFQPDLFILLEVSEEILVERVVGRRLDPVTGKIYHLKYSPPESEEIAARLTQRFDDTEEKVKLRLRTHHQNVEAVLSMYEDITVKVNGNASMQEVFEQIDNALTEFIEHREAIPGSVAA
ncbi:hypothetical protein SAY87_000101 [Trapa incisa]|uniref:adenylate kinase n=1 Tax=Trapa incisa TaxID=236973 RepID=A0AAN7GB74_9MYRT|nr:hypothetical protein SAY87_000101 [Trapa incisa]